MGAVRGEWVGEGIKGVEREGWIRGRFREKTENNQIIRRLKGHNMQQSGPTGPNLSKWKNNRNTTSQAN